MVFFYQQMIDQGCFHPAPPRPTFFFNDTATTEIYTLSPHDALPIASYRDTFKLLTAFSGDVRSIPPDRLTLDHIDAAAITGFLNWLETERHNSISTRNQRLAGLSSVFRWLQQQDPAPMAGCQDILAVPAKKTAQPGVNHLTVEQARRLLAAPDRPTRRGRPAPAPLATLYDSASP